MLVLNKLENGEQIDITATGGEKTLLDFDIVWINIYDGEGLNDTSLVISGVVNDQKLAFELMLNDGSFELAYTVDADVDGSFVIKGNDSDGYHEFLFSYQYGDVCKKLGYAITSSANNFEIEYEIVGLERVERVATSNMRDGWDEYGNPIYVIVERTTWKTIISTKGKIQLIAE